MDPSAIVVNFDRRQLMGMTAAGLPIGVVSVLVLVFASELAWLESPLFLRMLAAFCALFFGGWGLVAARHVLYFGPAFVVDAEGIIDMASLARPGRIPWSNIAGFRAATLTGQSLLVVRLRDAEAATRSAPLWLRPVCWASQRRFGSPVVVPVTVLRASRGELLATCRRLRKTAKERAKRAAADSTSNG